MNIIPYLSTDAISDIVRTVARFSHQGPKSRQRAQAVRQLSTLYNVTRSHIYTICKNAQNEPVAAISEAPVAHLAVEAFREAGMANAPTGDVVADLLLLQSELPGWAIQAESYNLRLHKLAVDISNALATIEDTRNLVLSNQELEARLTVMEAQVQAHKDTIDREREERRGIHTETHGE